MNAQWYYETTGPGSGLPVMSTLKDMQQSGDRIKRVEGIFSGTLAYLLNAVNQGVPFSSALVSAGELGLSEPDPRDDLSGSDVMRKVVVLARELGLPLEQSEVHVESLLPGLDGWQPDESPGAPTLLTQLVEWVKPFDESITARVEAAKAESKVLTCLCCVDVGKGTAEVTLSSLPQDSSLARCTGVENIVAITSERYSPSPLVISGPGAGWPITASGLFSDLLKLSRSVVEWTIPKFQ